MQGVSKQVSFFAMQFYCLGSHHHRRSERPCERVPPGNRKRTFCDSHRQYEHKCKCLIKRNNVLHPCDNDIDGPKNEHCALHNNYVIGCNGCADAIVPRKNFCRSHRALEEKARAALKKRQDRYDQNRRAVVRGDRRHHVREDSDVEIESDDNDPLENAEVEDQKEENDGNIPSTWKFKVGRCWLYGYYVVVKPCGYILWAAPLFRSEGCKRVVEIWNECYSRRDKPIYTWTDMGCTIWRFINNKPVLRNIWTHTRWLVDRFHGNKSHSMNNPNAVNFCTQHCDVTKMRIAAKPPGIHGVSNSQAQEQVMPKMAAFTWMQNMHYDLQWFNLFWVTFDLNIDLLIAMKEEEINFVPDLCLYE
eukprot:937441_1